MSKTIYKFSLRLIDDIQEIGMPKNAEIISVQNQSGLICIWAIVNPNNKYESRSFKIYGTGHNILENPGNHIGTIVNGSYVWHVFESIGFSKKRELSDETQS